MDVEIESFRDYRLSNSLEEKLSYRPDIDALLETGGISAQGIEAIIANATENLAEVRIEIFGDNTDAHDYETLEGTDVVIEDQSTDDNFGDAIINTIKGVGESIANLFTGDDSTEYETVTKTIRSLEGEFNVHVGYAPEIMADASMEDALSESKFKNKIKFQGTGEMGRIMLAYQRYNTIEGEAWNRFGAALWEQRLWDDDGSDFKAPTIKNIMDIGISIVGAALGGGIGAAVLNMIDDAIFTTADIANGRKTVTEGLVDFGKTAAIGLATTGIGEALGPAALDLASSSLGDIAGHALQQVGVQALNNTATGIISGIQYSSEGGFSYNSSSLGESVFGINAVAGYAGTFAGSLTGGVLNKKLGNTDAGWMRGAVNIASSTAGKMAEYAVHLGHAALSSNGEDFGSIATRAFDNMGGIGINLLDVGALLDMFRSSKVAGQDGYDAETEEAWAKAVNNLKGTGLFEVRFTSKGVTGQFSTGGMNIMGNLYQLGKDLSTKDRITAAMDAYEGTEQEKQAYYNTLANNYLFADFAGQDTVNRILSGKDKLMVGGLPETNAFGIPVDQTASGYTEADENGNRTIFLAELGDSGSIGSVALQHEAWRDGIRDGDIEETIRAGNAHFALAQLIAGEDPMLAQEILNHEIFGADFKMLELAKQLSENSEGAISAEEILNNYFGTVYSSNEDYLQVKYESYGNIMMSEMGSAEIIPFDSYPEMTTGEELSMSIRLLMDLGAMLAPAGSMLSGAGMMNDMHDLANADSLGEGLFTLALAVLPDAIDALGSSLRATKYVSDVNTIQRSFDEIKDVIDTNFDGMYEAISDSMGRQYIRRARGMADELPQLSLNDFTDFDVVSVREVDISDVVQNQIGTITNLYRLGKSSLSALQASIIAEHTTPEQVEELFTNIIEMDSVERINAIANIEQEFMKDFVEYSLNGMQDSQYPIPFVRIDGQYTGTDYFERLWSKPNEYVSFDRYSIFSPYSYPSSDTDYEFTDPGEHFQFLLEEFKFNQIANGKVEYYFVEVY